MDHHSIPGFCERCGQRYEFARPAPGERDLGLDRIQATFRYCPSCQLYVGRTCCWNPDAVACIVDAPPFALSTSLLPGIMPEGSSHEVVVRRGIAELAASLDAIEKIHRRMGLLPQTDKEREIARSVWDDAWWAVGCLIARAETSRDAAAKALRRVAAGADAPTTEDQTDQLTRLVATYDRARAMIEARLVAVGKSLAPRHRRKRFIVPRARLERATIGIGALAAVGVLAFGAAALLQLGYVNPYAPDGAALASHPEGAVLGRAGGPEPSGSAPSTPAPHAPTAVIVWMDFDELRIGPLAGSSDEVGKVVGGPEVVAYPSPFDRSIRVVGKGSHRFCMPTPNLEEARVSFEMSIYSETRVISGGLKLSVAPPGAGPTAARVPLKLVDGLALQAWHRLRVEWTPRQPVAITLGDAPLGPTPTTTLPPAHDTRAVAGAVCVTVSGMAPDAVVLLDKLRVEQ
jgi:hypothetical protein